MPRLGEITPQGKMYILGIAFLGHPVSERLWVGLAKMPQNEGVSLADLAQTEPRGAGYERQPLDPEDWKVVGDALASKEVTFTNTGPDVWTGVDIAFLATSDKGTGGTLLAWSTLRRDRMLMGGDRLSIPFQVAFRG